MRGDLLFGLVMKFEWAQANAVLESESLPRAIADRGFAGEFGESDGAVSGAGERGGLRDDVCVLDVWEVDDGDDAAAE